ncbi:MAG: carboxypeptidase regulatory-like domain-containing protein [Labilithrix sp.]|nr:carboxypeptidase regulatory-like domain-containing protein [Labilithrix sp.]
MIFHASNRSLPRLPITALVGIVFILASLWHAPRADAAPLRVRVRGAAKLSARASRHVAPVDVRGAAEGGSPPAPGTNELLLSGSLTDDAGEPLALQRVVIRVTKEADPHDARTAAGIAGARGCDRAADPTPGAPSGARRGPTAWGVAVSGPTDAPEVTATTDEEGRFCFRARLDPDRYKANLVYTPPATQALVDGIEREIAFDLSRRGLALRFDPTPRVVQLDTPQATIEAVAIVDDDGDPRVAPALGLVLGNEKEELARAVTDAAGRARFVLPGAKLGAPGPGELRVSFAGDGETARASHSEDVERHVKVVVKVPAADRGALEAAVPEDGIALLAEVHSTLDAPDAGGEALGPLSEGSVEARIGDVVVGAAPVERGIARLLLTFTAQGSEALVRLRYVPASPWYEPLGEPVVRLPIRGPSLWSKAPILLAGLAVLAFFLVGRVSGQKSKPEPAPAKANGEARDAKPGVALVRPAERGAEGWTGRVVDTHEGTPVGRARVWIERGTFEGRAVLTSVETDADGRFTLPGIGAVAGDESLGAEGRLHARLSQDLPPPGEIAIALAQRRRAMLARLVTWARRRGPPFDTRPEPTPGHVRRAAAAERATARWAEAVERAAFGPGDVDARAEQEVDQLAPEDGPEPARAPNDARPRPRDR